MVQIHLSRNLSGTSHAGDIEHKLKIKFTELTEYSPGGWWFESTEGRNVPL